MITTLTTSDTTLSLKKFWLFTFVFDAPSPGFQRASSMNHGKNSWFTRISLSLSAATHRYAFVFIEQNTANRDLSMTTTTQRTNERFLPLSNFKFSDCITKPFPQCVIIKCELYVAKLDIPVVARKAPVAKTDMGILKVFLWNPSHPGLRKEISTSAFFRRIPCVVLMFKFVFINDFMDTVTCNFGGSKLIIYINSGRVKVTAKSRNDGFVHNNNFVYRTSDLNKATIEEKSTGGSVLVG